MQKKIIIFDFDGTLTPYPVTRFKILDKCGYKGGVHNPEIVKLFQEMLQNDQVNFYGAVYRAFIDKVNESPYKMTDSNISMGAEEQVFNKGVISFLKMLNDNNVVNYIVSSGLKVYIEKTKVNEYFTKIYGTTFKYDSNGVAVDLEFLIDDETKAMVIEEIIRDNNMVDCKNVIYVGDSISDYYAMKYVKDNGGQTIFVYQDDESDDIKKVRNSGVVSSFFLADYSEGSKLNEYIKNWGV